MLSYNPTIYRLKFGYHGGLDPSNYARVRINMDPPYGTGSQKTIFEIIAATIIDPESSVLATESFAVHWNQTPSLYFGDVNYTGSTTVPTTLTEPRVYTELLTLPYGSNWWINSQFSYKRYLSENLSYLEFWLSKLDGAPITVNAATSSRWEFHLIFQIS
jgi:hypothetical protein